MIKNRLLFNIEEVIDTALEQVMNDDYLPEEQHVDILKIYTNAIDLKQKIEEIDWSVVNES